MKPFSLRPKLIVLLLFLTVQPLFAAGQEVQDRVLAALKSGYAKTDDLHAVFSQRTYVAPLKREEKGAGEMFLRKKGGVAQFRFNYTKPKQQIISNGKTVWYYLPENKQVIVTDAAKLFAGGNGLALSYLTGLGTIEEDFEVKLFSDTPDKKGNYQLDLTPKKPSAAVKKLQLFISSAALDKDSSEPFFPISSSTIIDQGGNRSSIDYSRIKVNSGVSGDKFNFTPPAGVDIIKQ